MLNKDSKFKVQNTALQQYTGLNYLNISGRGDRLDESCKHKLYIKT